MLRIIYIIFGLLLTGPFLATAELVIIVNPANKMSQIHKNDVVDLFMGRYIVFPNGQLALPLDQPVDSRERELFYASMTGKSVSQVNAYWAKLIFSGRATPPKVMPDASTTLMVVSQNTDAIAYLFREDIDESVKVVMSLE